MRHSLFLTALLLLPGTFVVSFGQTTTAVIRGRVTDSGGTGLPGVVVGIRSARQPSGNTRAITDLDGRYRSTAVPVADDYVLRVDYPGFSPVEVGPIHLDAGRTVVQDIVLRSGAESTETVVVESTGSIVDLETTKTSTSYNAEFIEGLPIIGHNYQDILTLAPGVTDTDGDGNPNVHGARDTGMQYRLDGGNITDPFRGTYGQNLNAEMIEEVEVITAGASAEYGRADGGFANIITKSGGNDFEGKFMIYWQGRFLDGNGANNNDVNRFHNTFADFQDVRPTLSLGGAIVKDRLWYFGTVELLDTERPVNQINTNILVTSRGNYSFGKVTWQVDSDNKLAFQVTGDPRTFQGLGLRVGVSPDSDYRLQQGSLTTQVKWTSTISPRLLMETAVGGFDSRLQTDSVSPHFKRIDVKLNVAEGSVQAEYPCIIQNCSPQRGENSIYQINLQTGNVNGPYYLELDQSARRHFMKTDLSLTVDDAWGQHGIKGGLEFQDEIFEDEPLTNPVLFDETTPYNPMSPGDSAESADERVSGHQILQVYDPLVTPQRAASFNSGLYVLDAWKPRPNLTLNFGLRLDREDIDTSGYVFFDPRDERRRGTALWRRICEAADGLDQATEEFNLLPRGQNCYQYSQNPEGFNGLPPQFGQVLPLDHPSLPITDPQIRTLDLDDDGTLESTGLEGDGILDRLTSYEERQTSNFSVVNNNLAPRLSVAWDPAADGKTKLFGTWGRYYDRLFLGTVAQEIGPDTQNFTFFPDSSTHVLNELSMSRAVSTTSVTQTDRDLRTPYTDELTLGFEREVAPVWAAGVTYIRRTGSDLLQDTDLNHITCPQHDLIGVNPYTICGSAGVLENDRFGQVGGVIGIVAGGLVMGGTPGFNVAGAGGRKLPNGAPDLYTVNFNFNQVLRVENANSYEYEAVELKILRRLHRNWQMQASYTWSEAFGQAESFISRLGNDPETVDDEEGYLSYDQRHVLKFQAVTRLPREISLGAIVQWAAGTPYSVTRSLGEFDSTGNIVVRTFYPSGQRNDNRNEGIWKVDARVEKNFVMGKVQASAFLNVENLLDSDDLVILNVSDLANIGLDGYREFGRRFELGATFRF